MRLDNWRELGEGDDVEFDIHCKMNRAWANEFLSMLNLMESLGNIGGSKTISFYADGDGDFKPKFKTDFKFEKKDYLTLPNCEICFDAG